MVQTNPSGLAAEGHDLCLYFNNTASYHTAYDINDFDNPHNLQLCTSLQDDITLADGSVIVLEGIGKV